MFFIGFIWQNKSWQLLSISKCHPLLKKKMLFDIALGTLVRECVDLFCELKIYTQSELLLL